MKKYIPTTLFTLFSVIIAINVLDYFYSDFEVMVVSILVVIWTHVVQGFNGINLSNIRNLLITNKQSIEDISDDEGKKLNDDLKIQEIKFYIISTGNFIIWIMAVFKIMGIL